MFRNMMNDRVVIHKQDGTTSQMLPAVVSRSGITIDHNGLLILPGDLVVRHMSNGAEETYKVLDPGFHEGHARIPAGYHMKVQNLSIAEARTELSHIQINITGNNNRVLQNSTDNSVNIESHTQQIWERFHELRDAALATKLSASKKEDVEAALESIENQIGSDRPNKRIVQSMLDLLPPVANVAAIGQALLAAISAITG